VLIASVNQDRGIKPGADKGAAVHQAAMRAALAGCGARVLEVDASDDAAVAAALEQAEGLNLVYERYALGCGVAGRVAADLGVPHVLEVNAPLLDEAARHRGALADAAARQREQEILRRATILLAVSSEVARWLKQEGVSPERVRVRPNGVDPQRFHPGLRTRDDDTFVLGFHGRLRPWHGFEHLVDVFARLVSRGLPVRLEVVGRGDYAELLAARLPPESWRVTPWVPHAEVGAHVARFDALALTYSPDGPCYFSPLKLLEAMAVGAVPLVPDLGDLPALVRHGRDGVVYLAGDWDGLEQALTGLILRREWRDELGAAAAASARGRTWEALAQEVLELVPARRSAAP